MTGRTTPSNGSCEWAENILERKASHLEEKQDRIEGENVLNIRISYVGDVIYDDRG